MAVKTFRARFFLQKIFKVRSVRVVTGSTFTFGRRCMEMGKALQTGDKVLMTRGTEFATRASKKPFIFGDMDLVTVSTFALDQRLMANSTNKILAFMAFEAVV